MVRRYCAVKRWTASAWSGRVINVDDSALRALRDDLLRDLSALSDLLRQCGETPWADWLGQDHDRISSGDGYGLDHLLQAFGGMGSISDLPIQPVNGQALELDDAVPVNDRINDLRGRIYSAAAQLRAATREYE